MDILIKSAKVISSKSEYHKQKVDILIKDGVITEISDKIENNDYMLVEKDNLHVSVGWFDPTVSFGEPGYEENETIESGLNAAAAGGFTAVGLLPNTSPSTDKKSDVEFLIKRSADKAVNIFPIGSLSKERKGKELSETFEMSNSGAIAFGDDKSLENAKLMEISLMYNKAIDKVVLSFPDTESISQGGQINEGEVSTDLGLKGIPALSEELRVSRDLFLTEYTGAKIHFQNISSARSLKMIEEAKEKGLDVTVQAAIHNIALDDSELYDFDTRFKVMPPLRTSKDSEALVEGLKNGVIDFVSSDHRPKDVERKFKEFDHASFGTIGLESAFGALNNVLSGRLGLTDIISLISTRPRKRFSIPLPKIKVGEKADLTLFDPDREYVFEEGQIRSMSKNSAFLGKKLKGHVYGIVSGNHIKFN